MIPRLLLVLLFFSPAALAQVQLSIPREGSLRIEGVTAGGQVLLFGVSQDRPGLHLRTRSWETILSAETSTLEVELGTLLTNRSVWFVSDLSSGSWMAFAVDPDQVHPLSIDLTRQDLRQRAAFLEAAFTRRGVGAWRYSGGDGGETDADGVPDGKVKLLLSALVPVGDSPAIAGPVQADDMVFIVDTEMMQFGVVSLR